MKTVSRDNKKFTKKMVCVLLIFLLLGLLYCIWDMAKTTVESGYDVVYAIDNSGSISKNSKYTKARLQAFQDITKMASGNNIRVGAVFFGDLVETRDVLPLTIMDELGTKKVSEFLDKEHDKRNYHTDIGEGLKCAQTLFKNASRKKVLILFTDGVDDNDYLDPSKETKKQVKVLEEKGIPIYCIYFDGQKNDMAALKNIVNYYGNTDYSKTRLISTDEVLKAVNLKAFLDDVYENTLVSRIRIIDVLPYCGIACLILVVCIGMLGKKDKRALVHSSKNIETSQNSTSSKEEENRENQAADESSVSVYGYKDLKSLSKELETLQLLCTQEILKWRKTRENVLWNSVLNNYDVSKMTALTADVQSVDSLLCEARIRMENKECLLSEDAKRNLNGLCQELQEKLGLLESDLDQLREENTSLASFLEQYR